MGQLYYKDLYQEFFNKYPPNATDFLAVTGYVGAVPLRDLQALPFKSKIIFGLQKEGSSLILHDQLVRIHGNGDKVAILYPDILSHAKCYLWLKGDEPIRGLIGSANFSINGLRNDFRETLAEVEKPDLGAILAYINIISKSSKACIDVTISYKIKHTKQLVQNVTGDCEMPLYDISTGEVQSQAGLNWGFSNGNVVPGDAYIPIRVENIRNYPDLFQPISWCPGDGHRSRAKNGKEAVEIIWDDGEIMSALFEGSQPVDGFKYPKQISSIPNKNILGEYMRNRLGLPIVTSQKNPSEKITRVDLRKYGRDSITLKLIEPGIYSADFSV